MGEVLKDNAGIICISNCILSVVESGLGNSMAESMLSFVQSNRCVYSGCITATGSSIRFVCGGTLVLQIP
jgi:hypothetical protein